MWSHIRVFLEGVDNLRKEAQAWAERRGAKVVAKVSAFFSRPARHLPEGTGVLNVPVLGHFSGTSVRGTKGGSKDLGAHGGGDRSFRPHEWSKALGGGPYPDMEHRVMLHAQF